MEYRRMGDHIVARLDKGEEIIQQLRLLCQAEGVQLAAVRALGAVGDFTVGVFKTAEKTYYSNSFRGDYEIVSLTGTVTTQQGNFYAHLHMSAGDAAGRVFGGHLNSAVVSATCEMVLTLLPGRVERVFDDGVGLNLMSFE